MFFIVRLMATTAICSVANCSVHSIFLISVSGKNKSVFAIQTDKSLFFQVKIQVRKSIAR